MEDTEFQMENRATPVRTVSGPMTPAKSPPVDELSASGRQRRKFSFGGMLGSPLGSGGNSTPASVSQSPSKPSLGRSKSMHSQKSPQLNRSRSKRSAFADFLSGDVFGDSLNNHVSISMPQDKAASPLEVPGNTSTFSDTWKRSTAENFGSIHQLPPQQSEQILADERLQEQQYMPAKKKSFTSAFKDRRRARKENKAQERSNRVSPEELHSSYHEVDIEDEEVNPGWCINFCMSSRAGKTRISQWLLWRIVAIWMVLGLGLTTTTFVIIYRKGRQNQQSSTDTSCLAYATQLQRDFISESQHVREFSDLLSTFYYSGSTTAILTQQLFSSFSSSTEYNRLRVNGLVFAERIIDKYRRLTEVTLGGCITQGDGIMCAPRKAEYSVLRFTSFNISEASIYSIQKMLPIGLDCSTESEFLVPILRSRDNGVVGALSSSLSIFGDLNSVLLLRVYPVYANKPPKNATMEMFQTATKGYLMGIFNFSSTAEAIFSEEILSVDPIVIQVVDVTNTLAPDIMWQFRDFQNGNRYTAAIPLDFGDEGRSYEVRCQHIDGEWFPWKAIQWSLIVLFLVTLSFFTVRVGIKSLRRMGRDYQRMKNLKERMADAKVAAESASRAKGAFLATMSHEIRTPMNGVIGMLNLLLGTRLDATQLDYVETARTSGRALCALINDVLDLSKIEAGHMELEKIPFQLGSEIDDVISMFAEKARESASIELAAIVQNDIPARVVGDPLRFRQVLINLLGNSFKFTKSGHIFVTVRVADPDEVLDVPQEDDEGERATATAAPEVKEEKAGETHFKDSSSFSAIPGAPPPSTFPSASHPPPMTDEYLTLSGKEATESCNSWSKIQELLQRGKEGEEERKTEKKQQRQYVAGQVVRLVISCEDTGMGIPSWARAGIFKPFTQADTSTTRLHGGTGIGLTICQRLVNMMGGKLSFVSKPGVGTTFYFDCFLEVSEGRGTPALRGLSLGMEPKLPPPSSPPGQNEGQTEQKEQNIEAEVEQRVLVVDHRPVRRAVVSWQFQRLGLKVDACSSVEEASRLIRASQGGGGSCQEAFTPHSHPLPLPASDSSASSSSSSTSLSVTLDSLRNTPQCGSGEIPTPRMPVGPTGVLGLHRKRREEGEESRRGLKGRRSVSLTSNLQLKDALGMVAMEEDEEDKEEATRGEQVNEIRERKKLPSPPPPAPPSAVGLAQSCPHAHLSPSTSSPTFSSSSSPPLPPSPSFYYCAVFVDNEEIKVDFSGANFEEAYANALKKATAALSITYPNPNPSPNPSLSPNGSQGGRAVHGKPPSHSSHSSLSPPRPPSASSSTSPSSALCRSPLVLVTRERGTEEASRKAGFDAIMLKPLRKGSLSACLVQLFSGVGLARTPSGGIVAVGQTQNLSPGSISPVNRKEGTSLPPSKPSSLSRTVSQVEVPFQEQGHAAALNELFSGKKLLIVDDNMVNRKVISKMLQRYGAKTEQVDSGIKAIERMKPPHDFDLVFMDVQMPLMDGYEATRGIRKLEAEQDSSEKIRVPIFALTADIVVGTREKCTESGMDGFLSKPIEEDQLYRVLPPFFESRQ